MLKHSPLCALLLACLLCSGSADAAIVLGRVTWTGPVAGSPNFYFLGKHYTSFSSPSDAARFDVVSTTTLDPTQITLGHNFEAYLVDEGTEFTLGYAASHTPILENSPLISGSGDPFSILPAQSVFIAILNQNAPWEGGSQLLTTQYSWVKLTNTAGIIQMTGEATSIASGGIIVGTTTEIPEPGTAVLVSGLAAFAFRRRRIA